MNDPFELNSVDMTHPSSELISQSLQHFQKSFGVICFSECWDDSLLWAHYADKHKGICIGFDFPESHLYPINYTDVRPKPDSYSQNHLVETPGDIGEDISRVMRDVLLSKQKCWNYERERRSIIELKPQMFDPIEGLYFLPFGRDSNVSVREIILGVRNPLNDIQQRLQYAIGDRYEMYQITQASLAGDSFKVVEKERWSRITAGFIIA